MLVFFLPNGIGDLIMAIPALRRLLNNIEARQITVVVANRSQSLILKEAVSSDINILERYDGSCFSQLKLWIKIFFLNAEIVFAPMISSKKINTLFFISLFTKIVVPNDYINKVPNCFIRSEFSLSNIGMHQVNYYIMFLSQFFNNISKEPASQFELQLSHKDYVNLNYPLSSSAFANHIKIVVGISCGYLERHKIPEPYFFSGLLNQLATNHKLHILMIGNQADVHLIQKVVQKLRSDIAVEVIVDSPIGELINKMSSCHAGISGTTGQGHMMAAAGLPMLVLAGVTDPFQSGPYANRVAILRHRYKCGPCYQESYRFGCQEVQCMNTLDVNEGVGLLKHLISDPLFGEFWINKANKPRTITLNEIKTLHLKPKDKWVL